MSSDLDVKLITSESDFHALEAEWNLLLQDSNSVNIFLTWEWISTWWECFGHAGRLRIFVVRCGSGELVGLAPLFQQKASLVRGFFFKHRELAFLGANSAAPDHLDFIIRRGYENEVAPVLVDYIISRSDSDILRLDGMISSSPILGLFTGKRRSWGGYIFQKQSAIAYLPENWDEFLRSRGKNLRRNVLRYRQQLEKDFSGQIQFVQVREEARLGPALQTVVQLAQIVKESHGENYSLRDANLQAFLYKIMIKFNDRGWLRVYTLNVGGKEIAASICYHYDNVRSIYQSGYDVTWRNYSPGQLIRAHCIQQAIVEGASACDFLRGEHIYKNEWANDTKLNAYLKIGYSLYGKILVSIFVAAHRFRGWVRGLVNK